MEAFEKLSTKKLERFRDTLIWMLGEVDLELSKRNDTLLSR
jgi:hypothetical protein